MRPKSDILECDILTNSMLAIYIITRFSSKTVLVGIPHGQFQEVFCFCNALAVYIISEGGGQG
jgi:hypothetical protein